MKERQIPQNNKNYNEPMMKVFLRYFRPHIGLFILDLSCALLASCIDLAFPLVARRAMYNMLPNKAYEVFFIVMAVFVVAFVLKAALHFIITYWGHMFGVRVEADLREDLFVHMQSLDFEFFDHNRTGQLLSRMTGDLFEITEFAHHGPEDLFIALVTIIGAIIIMFTIQWQLALLILVILPIFLFIVLLCRRRMVRTSKQVKVKLAEINGEIEQKDTPAFVLGRAAHSLILEGRTAFDRDFVVTDGPVNPKTGEHLFTTSTAEAEAIRKAGWKQEGGVMGVWKTPKVSAHRIYRLYNPNNGFHHYSMTKAEIDMLVRAGWKNEGIAYYSDEKKGVPVYREYNPNNGQHNYTTSLKEHRRLASLGWKAEGIAWYGLK